MPRKPITLRSRFSSKTRVLSPIFSLGWRNYEG